MTRRLTSWLACSLALLLVAASTFWAFQRYVGADAPRYFGAGLFPCPFHASPARWDSRISAPLLPVSPTADWLEYMDLVSPILREAFRVERGHVIAPDRPGAGLDRDEAALAQLASR